MDLNKKSMKNMMLLIVFAVVCYVGVQNLDRVLEGVSFIQGILSPFVLGAAMAFILNVPMNGLETRLFHRGKKSGKESEKESEKGKKLVRPLSLVLAICLVIAVIMVVILVLVPELGRTFGTLSASIEAELPRLQSWALETFQDNEQLENWIQSLEFNWDKIIGTAIDFLRNGAGNVLNSTMSVAKTLISTLTNFFIGIVFACYILLQKEKLSKQIKKVLYAFLPSVVVERTLEVASLSYRTFSNFVTGQCMEAVILGTMFFVAMTLLRFPYALLVGVVIAFTALIPVFGAFIGCVVGTFLILVENPMQAIAFVVLFLVLQQIEGNLIYPHVVGGSVGLPSIWVLVAVTVGGSLMGVVGMLVFIPLSSVLYTLFRGWVYKRLEVKKIHDI